MRRIWSRNMKTKLQVKIHAKVNSPKVTASNKCTWRIFYGLQFRRRAFWTNPYPKYLHNIRPPVKPISAPHLVPWTHDNWLPWKRKTVVSSLHGQFVASCSVRYVHMLAIRCESLVPSLQAVTWTMAVWRMQWRCDGDGDDDTDRSVWIIASVCDWRGKVTRISKHW